MIRNGTRSLPPESLDIYLFMRRERSLDRMESRIRKTLQKEILGGRYHHQRSKDYWKPLVTEAAKKYHAKFGDPSQNWNHTVSKKTVEEIAQYLSDGFLAEHATPILNKDTARALYR